jgi:hypothetical protein
MARAKKMRELPDKLPKSAPRGWEVKDLWPFLVDMKDKAVRQKKKISKLEEVVSEHTDPGERLISGLAETGVAVGGGFLNPFLVSLLGEEWEELAVTDDFGIDTEAITAGGIYGLGLFLFWRDMAYGKWVFEAGKGAIASYAGHVGRNLGAQLALPAAEPAA